MQLKGDWVMIRTPDGPVNPAGSRLPRTTYESPVDVAAGFEQMSCSRGGHARGWHNIPKSGTCKYVCCRRLGSIDVKVACDDNRLRGVINGSVLQDLVQLRKAQFIIGAALQVKVVADN